MKNSNAFVVALGATCFMGLASTARADVTLYPLFTDNMVLQRDKPLLIWGTAEPGEAVTVAVGTQTGKAVAGADGAWSVTLKKLAATNVVPFKVSGKNTVQLQNVAVGDVYICSGQSNMEWSVGAANNAPDEIAKANFPGIRLFTVPKAVSAIPMKKFAGPTSWQLCTPESVPGFSAVGYFFGRELNQRLGVPIGLINSSWGGTIAQAWTSQETLLKRDDLRAETEELIKTFGEDEATFTARRTAWFEANDPGSKAPWSAATLDEAAWKTMALPAYFDTATAPLPNFDGIVWFRKTLDIPAAWEGKDLVLHLGSIDDSDDTYFNGVAVGATDGWTLKRDYTIPAAQVKAGQATIAVRVLDTGGGGGLYGNDTLRLEVKADPTQKTELTGDWKYQVGAALGNLPPAPMRPGGDPNHPTLLYNGMIAPLVPFPVRGAIWYQGESNAGNAAQYRTLFPDLIRDWRTHWGVKQDGSDFGFYFVQLANFMGRTTEPVESGWADLRDAQTGTLAVPRTGMATIIDIGDAGDIHPRNKQDVGKRLALNALVSEYGQKIEYTGPTYKAMKVKDNTVRVEFSHAGGLKTTDGAAPKAFALLGADGKWYAATAQIDGGAIVLSNPAVTDPKAVRYAWANNPDTNLYNEAGLPANPFRTDTP